MSWRRRMFRDVVVPPPVEERTEGDTYLVPSSGSDGPHLIANVACAAGCGYVLPIAVRYPCGGSCPRCGERFSR